MTHVGHAPHLLKTCGVCPPWAAEYAKATNDDGIPVCKPHALETIPMLTEGI